MNWRRGCFRVWLVASALWVLGCSLLMWPDIEQRVSFALLSDKELLFLVCLEKLGLTASTAEEDARVFCEKKFPEELPEETKARLLKDEHSFTEQSFNVAKAVFSDLRLWLWLLGPPVFVLLLGAFIGWALVGFRKAKSE
jgi:hypothetical protein